MEHEIAVDARDAADVGCMANGASDLREQGLALASLVTFRSIGRARLDRPGQRVDKRNERAELAFGKVTFDLGIAPLDHRLGLLHPRVPQAEFVGAGRRDELLKRGELRLPAELAHATSRKEPDPPRRNCRPSSRQ